MKLTECQTPQMTFSAHFLNGEAVRNPYVSGNSTVCQTPQIHLSCAIINGEAIRNPYEWWGHSTECQTPRCTSCVPLLTEEANWNHTSRETQQSAKHRRCTSCMHFLCGQALWNPYEWGYKIECQLRTALLVRPCLVKKPFGIRMGL